MPSYPSNFEVVVLNLIIPAAAVGLCAVVPAVSCTASVPWMSRVTEGDVAPPIVAPVELNLKFLDPANQKSKTLPA